MGYQTDFEGRVFISPPLTAVHTDYIKLFCKTRRMRRNSSMAQEMADPVRVAAGLPLGFEGAYFTGGRGLFGQDSDPSVILSNSPPQGQPGLWCHWTTDGEYLFWDGGEKFYHYVEWLQYLIDHFYERWGYRLNGKIQWRGESFSDIGTIIVEGNEVVARSGLH